MTLRPSTCSCRPSSSWPPAADLKLIGQADEFVRDHGDIFERHEDNGIPWVEATAGGPLSKEFMKHWADQKAKAGDDQKIFLETSIQDKDSFALE